MTGSLKKNRESESTACRHDDKHGAGVRGGLDAGARTGDVLFPVRWDQELAQRDLVLEMRADKITKKVEQKETWTTKISEPEFAATMIPWTCYARIGVWELRDRCAIYLVRVGFGRTERRRRDRGLGHGEVDDSAWRQGDRGSELLKRDERKAGAVD